MSERPPPRARRPRPPTFQPRATLALVYVAVLTVVYAFLLVTPSLWKVLHSGPPGPELEHAAHEAARGIGRARLLLALALAVVTVALGERAGKLPGLRR